MRKLLLTAALAALLLSSAAIAGPDKKDDKSKPEPKHDAALVEPQTSASEGSVSVEGHRVDYKAVAGTHGECARLSRRWPADDARNIESGAQHGTLRRHPAYRRHRHR